MFYDGTVPVNPTTGTISKDTKVIHTDRVHVERYSTTAENENLFTDPTLQVLLYRWLNKGERPFCRTSRCLLANRSVNVPQEVVTAQNR